MPSGIYIRTKEHNKNISKSLTGKKKSKKHNRNNSLSHLGQKAWNKNLTKETDFRVARYAASLSKSRKGIISESTTGSKHWNWQGGKSFEPYPLGWNNTFKEQIRYRDGYKCQVCGKPEVENMKKLSVHHIDYNKTNITLNNLISLCDSCHAKTNFNKDYWYAYFMYVMGEI